MNQEDYLNLHEYAYVGGGFMPYNDKAKEFCEGLSKGEIIPYKEATQRDIRFHRCYFALLNYIYKYLPKKFHAKLLENEFYKWLKHLKKEYKVVYKFKDKDKAIEIAEYCIELDINSEAAAKLALKFGYTEMIEYDSISFGRMGQKQFEEYVKEQLPYINENVIGAFYEGDIYNSIVETIEQEFERFMAKLK